jgi:adenylylsulfate kinase
MGNSRAAKGRIAGIGGVGHASMTRSTTKDDQQALQASFSNRTGEPLMDTMCAPKQENIVWHWSKVEREQRERQNGHRSVALWFTGLSGSGKSTLAHAVEERLHVSDCRTFVLDGDNVRHGLCSDLGFSRADREENIRRIGELTRLFMEAGIIVLTAFISPFRADREKVRQLVGEGGFLEIYCRCPLDVCEQRDVKGLYRRARAGQIPEFTGLTSPYEEPERPALVVDTGTRPLGECVDEVVNLLVDHNVISMASTQKQSARI